MSSLEWREGNLPISAQFDDPYYSIEDGRAETSHVFIKGNDLPTRWQSMDHCVIAELGFGTGLNFLETVYQWQNQRKANASLHFISFELFPLDSKDLTRALSAWPELKNLAKRLAELWNGQALNCEFAPEIQLTIHFGDANALLPTCNFKADSWYLDGFSPAKNPELWNETLIAEVGSHTVADGTFATYTAAGFVKRNLQSAGFEVQKTKGFGRKRDMLIGKLANDIHVATGY